MCLKVVDNECVVAGWCRVGGDYNNTITISFGRTYRLQQYNNLGSTRIRVGDFFLAHELHE